MLRRRRTESPVEPVQVVTLVTRVGCHLCEQAAPRVARAARDAGAAYQLLDVDVDPGPAEWSVKVPVVLLDGVEHAYWEVDEKALRAALGLRV